ncbi:hypothetical protein DFR58_12925 [Anaerobacterium chartisolvens]|uniref:Uncharacterized protein n=1 Tax=Anaerobacterium chartisolvens TaxID=1297424 RepID=A0A369AN04_9FIRM|nr:DUF6338 family protein [Anaerobacterium chartisolvens]RCX10433.1 hypothetical protein DFR58_12925 [Anaerobacterium chartisolvens]
MNFSVFVIRIILLLLPGIIGAKIYRKLRGKRTKKDWEDYSEIFIFSVVSYVLLGILQSVNLVIHPFSFSCKYSAITAFNAFVDEKAAINWDEVLFSVVIGIILAYIASYIYRFKIINRFGRLISATKRYGDEDVWDYLHNIPNIEWMVIRDHKINMYYYCWIKVFSETDEKRELLLGDVSVYNADGQFCYDTKAMYISREYHDLTIEFFDTGDIQDTQITGEERDQSE